MSDTIYRKDAIDAIEETTWYHIDLKGDLVEGARSNGTALYKAGDVYKALKSVPSADRRKTDSEVTRNSLRTDCTGCKFVGWYDTDFPCVNCIRKNKDYYTAEAE